MLFHHLQKVNIVSGFFEGLTGVITANRNNGVQEYFVETNSSISGQGYLRPTVWVEEKNLKEIIK